MKKPNFFCVGAQKASTTTLHEILKNHPQIYLPKCKETHYFNRDENYINGLDWYLKEYYSDVENEKAIGEIAPNYMYIEQAAERIYNDLGGDLKLIFIFRNPAERAYSNFLMSVKQKHEIYSFKKAIALEPKRRAEKYPPVFHYINRGFYDVQVQRLLQYFKKENMMFLVFEKDIVKNQKITISNILEFLDIESFEFDKDIKANPAEKMRSRKLYNTLYSKNLFTTIGKAIIPNKDAREKVRGVFARMNTKKYGKKKELDSLRRYLIDDVYKQSILNLENIIDRDLSLWYK
jgi:hypothetical protein